MADFIIPFLLLIDGLICVLGVVFAHTLGFDPDPAWGRTRLALLFLGSIPILISVLMLAGKYRGRDPFGLIQRCAASRSLILLGHLWAVIFLTYAWFLTYGTFTQWDHTSNYYSQLADAFNKGRTYLEVKPSQALLAAPDPYDLADRPRQEEIWDMSLYKGRIYLYWGPLPALIIAPLQVLFKIKIHDIFINLFFYSGLVIINSMILLKLRGNFFPDISKWNVFICIALLGLISPVLWALIPSTIYGAAIGAGHFFLMGGIYFVLAAFDRKPALDWKPLFLAGLFWACSMGSRALNAPSILGLAFLSALWIGKMAPPPLHWTKFIQSTLPLLLPLALGAAGIAWYNWARFDSPLEFGLRYQITFFNLNRDMHLTFQPDYFPLNLYVYLLQPFRLTSRFPFAIPLYTPDILSLHKIAAPKMFFAGRMTGLLFGAPFLLLSLVHLFPKKHAPGEGKPGGLGSLHDFVILSLGASFLIGMLGLMFFFFGQMRYLVDVISQITLLAILGYWRLVSARQAAPSAAPKLLAGVSTLLLVLTICISLLLAVTSETSRMEKYNPQLLERIADTLTFGR